MQAVLRDWLGRVRLGGSARLQVDIDPYSFPEIFTSKPALLPSLNPKISRDQSPTLALSLSP